MRNQLEYSAFQKYTEPSFKNIGALKMPSIVIIADDLSGALDASACFARRGHKVQVALTPDALPEAVNTGADVISVSTGSREGDEDTARAQIRRVLKHIPSGPQIIKKVDSRLKGHIAAETEELLSRGFDKIVVAPAIPKLGRIVEGGQLKGAGVISPKSVADGFGNLDCEIIVPDTATDDDMEIAVASVGPKTLVVGASGMTGAIARLEGNEETPLFAPKSERVLIAIGSRDPITLAQVDTLLDHHNGTEFVACPNGQRPEVLPDSSSVLVQLTQADVDEDSDVVTKRFSETLANIVEDYKPDAVVASGGETAQGMLSTLGIHSLELVGEASIGVPVSKCEITGRKVNILTKSGGFGEPPLLFELLSAMQN